MPARFYNHLYLFFCDMEKSLRNNVKCMFGLRRHCQICMCTFLLKRSDKCLNIIGFRCAFCWGHVPNLVEVTSKVCPKGAKIVPLSAPLVSEVAHRALKAQWMPRGTQSMPKVWPRVPKRCPGEPKVFPIRT